MQSPHQLTTLANHVLITVIQVAFGTISIPLYAQIQVIPHVKCNGVTLQVAGIIHMEV